MKEGTSLALPYLTSGPLAFFSGIDDPRSVADGGCCLLQRHPASTALGIVSMADPLHASDFALGSPYVLLYRIS